MFNSFIYNGLFYVFRFPGRLIKTMIYGGECWKKYRKADSKNAVKDETEAGSCISFAIFFALILVFAGDMAKKSTKTVLIVLVVMLVAAVVIGIVRDFKAIKNGRKQEIDAAFEEKTKADKARMDALEERIREKNEKAKSKEISTDDKPVGEGKIKCPHCGKIQSDFIKRCLNCGEIIEK